MIAKFFIKKTKDSWEKRVNAFKDGFLILLSMIRLFFDKSKRK